MADSARSTQLSNSTATGTPPSLSLPIPLNYEPRILARAIIDPFLRCWLVSETVAKGQCYPIVYGMPIICI